MDMTDKEKLEQLKEIYIYNNHAEPVTSVDWLIAELEKAWVEVESLKHSYSLLEAERERITWMNAQPSIAQEVNS
jgi:hypothetical protein